MDDTQTTSPDPVLRNIEAVLPELEAFYKDVHSHPELSMEELRTSALAADRLRAAGYEVTTGLGKTRVVEEPHRRRDGDDANGHGGKSNSMLGPELTSGAMSRGPVGQSLDPERSRAA